MKCMGQEGASYLWNLKNVIISTEVSRVEKEFTCSESTVQCTIDGFNFQMVGRGLLLYVCEYKINLIEVSM